MHIYALNVDFCRASMTLQHLRSFMTDLNLVSADLPFHSFTYMRDDGSASSWPDHFICDTSLAPDLLSSVVWILAPIFLIICL